MQNNQFWKIRQNAQVIIMSVCLFSFGGIEECSHILTISGRKPVDEKNIVQKLVKKKIKILKTNAAISSQLNSVKSSKQKNLSLEVRKNNNKFPWNECQILQFIKKAEYSY